MEINKEEAKIIMDLIHDEIARYSHSAPRELWNIFYKLETYYGN